MFRLTATPRTRVGKIRAMPRIPIRFGRLGWTLTMMGCTPSSSYLDVDDDLLRVRMGYAFRADVPRPSVRSAERAPDSPLSIGVHGWRGRWIVNGAASPMVAISVNPQARARVLGFPVKLRELRVSVDDPEALITALAG
jgi:hypothetical protein